jgi:hypothetical protein
MRVPPLASPARSHHHTKRAHSPAEPTKKEDDLIKGTGNLFQPLEDDEEPAEPVLDKKQCVLCCASFSVTCFFCVSSLYHHGPLARLRVLLPSNMLSKRERPISLNMCVAGSMGRGGGKSHLHILTFTYVLAGSNEDLPGEEPTPRGEPISDALFNDWDMHNGEGSSRLCAGVSSFVASCFHVFMPLA